MKYTPLSGMTSNWSRLTLVRPRTRAERKEMDQLPRPIPGIPESMRVPRLVARPARPAAAVGEVVSGPIRCGACGRKRGELIKTLRQFQCQRCVTHTQRMGEPEDMQ